MAGLSIPGLIGLTVATPYALLLASSFVFGFFFLGSSSIFFQYNAEINYPVSFGLATDPPLAKNRITTQSVDTESVVIKEDLSG